MKLQHPRSGKSISCLCREHGDTQTTFYEWKAKYSAINAALVTRIEALEEDNRRLSMKLADGSTSAEVIQKALKGWS